MLKYIVIILSILLDGILSNIFPYIPGSLSFFTPLLTIVSLVIIYPLYKKKEKKYLITCLCIGLIYDLLYTNLLFYNGIIFITLGIIIIKTLKNLGISYLKLLFYIIGLIIIYETFNTLFIILFDLVPITLTKLIYKISHSILLNVIYAELLFLIINLLPKRFKKIDIN